MSSRAWTIALLSFGLLMAALLSRSGSLALMGLPFLAYLAAAVLATPAREQIRLEAERTLSAIPTPEKTEIEVRVVLSNPTGKFFPLFFADPPQPETHIVEGSLQGWAALDAGEQAVLAYRFEAARGTYTWKTIPVTVSDPFDLFETRLDLSCPAEIQVHPRYLKYRPITFRPDSTLHVPGAIPAGLAGSGTDFWGIREYHPGDSLRRLDWRLTARHPQKFFTREFEQEEVADIALILDARQAIDLCLGDDSLFEHTLRATASLAEMFIHQGHRVSLFTFGDQMSMVYPGYSKVQLNRILRSLAKTKPGKTASRFGLDYIPLSVFPSSALLVVLSPLTPSDWSIFPRIRAHGNQGLLISPDPVDFALPFLHHDRAGQLAIRAARLERRIKLRKIAQIHIRVVDWQVSRPLALLVRNALQPKVNRIS